MEDLIECLARPRKATAAREALSFLRSRNLPLNPLRSPPVPERILLVFDWWFCGELWDE